MITNKKGISTIIATVLIVLITVAAVTILWAAVSPLIDNTADLGCFDVANAVKIDNNAQYTFAGNSITCYSDLSPTLNGFDATDNVYLGRDFDSDGDIDAVDCQSISGIPDSYLLNDDLGPDSSTGISIRVERSSDSENLAGMEFIIENNGNTITQYQAFGSSLEEDESTILENGKQVYTYVLFSAENVTGDGPDLTSGGLTGNIKVAVAPQILIDGEVTACGAGTSVDIKKV